MARVIYLLYMPHLAKPTNRDPNVWTTKEGKSIPIVELENGHLLNIYRMLKRMAIVYKAEAISAGYDASAFMVGEQAQYAVEDGIRYYVDTSSEDLIDEFCEQAEALRQEITKRNLWDAL